MIQLRHTASALTISAQTVNLPTVNIQGKQYYSYKVQKGDSPYGICKKFGWDESTLRASNSNFIKKISKGQTVYYPVSDKAADVMPEKRVAKVTEVAPATHRVSRGETVYSIAQLYGIPVERIYQNNPSSRHGIKAGEVLTIVQTPAAGVDTGTAPFYYTAKSGDTLYGIAKKYNAGLEQLLRDNPGVSEHNFKAGSTIKVTPNSNKTVMVKEQVTEEAVVGFTPYKVKKNDTWESIASSQGVDTVTLREVNQNSELPKKGEWVTVPRIEETTHEKIVEKSAVPDNTLSQRNEIYSNVHNIADERNLVNVAVVLDKPSAHSNIDFLRGFLLGVESFEKSGIKINMNVVDARNGVANAGADSVLNVSNLIIGVYDDDFPKYLANLAKNTGAEVVNVFDTKSSLYETEPQVIQILQPIDYFNDLTATYIYEQNPGSKLVLLGAPDDGDKFADILKSRYPAEDVLTMTLEQFKEYPFTESNRYVVYVPAKSTRKHVSSAWSPTSSTNFSTPYSTRQPSNVPKWLPKVFPHLRVQQPVRSSSRPTTLKHGPKRKRKSFSSASRLLPKTSAVWPWLRVSSQCAAV